MKHILLAAALGAATTGMAMAEPVKYELDPSHSQILYSFNHLGFSTTWHIFSEVEGELMFDQEDPANSSVSVAFPLRSMYTGWDKRFDHIMSGDFFGADEDAMVTFESTGIEVTGENTGKITGDLTVNGVTNEVVLDAVLNTTGMHPVNQVEGAGFSATTTILRSDYNVGAFAPNVSDELDVQINIEAMKAE
ncbi:hypothetical protein DDZ14_14470 [Maritimibacter sp. 55A14]|uniref:YceI family protein n=1 Tax=Maritimibacter sp. 55A14 TaxID=2174844 RepID=UPI000D60E9DA|nr:YceI family protein [Maritimibacter sp. 55A14]PWE30635.1 hypothetical protein DDZ14_14470 [Maritimibacter sp. 55A14]